MKKIIITTFIISLAIISCKKDTASTGGGSFTINGTSYNVTSTNRIITSNVVCLTFTSLNSQPSLFHLQLFPAKKILQAQAVALLQSMAPATM